MNTRTRLRRFAHGSYIAPIAGLLCAFAFSGCGGGNSVSTTNNNSNNGPTLTKTEFAYVVNEDDSTVAQYQIGADGTLTALTPATAPVAAHAVQALATPNGSFIYVLAQDQTTGVAAISQFKVNADGTLAPLSPATVSAGTLISGTSALTAATIPFQHPAQLMMDLQGRFLYAATSTQILRFPIGGNGALGAGVSVTTLTNTIQSFVLDPLGRFAYVGSKTAAGTVVVSPFTVNADGSFTPLVGKDAPLANVNAVFGLALDSKGRFLYASSITPQNAQGNTSLSSTRFTVRSDGTLTAGPTTVTDLSNGGSGTFDVNQFAQDLAIAFALPTFSANGQVVYLPTDTPHVLEESVGSDGALTLLGSGTALAGAATGMVAIEPSGLFAYVANQDTSISQFRINSDGTLSPLATPAIDTGHRPVSIATIVATVTLNRGAAKAGQP